MARHDPDTWNNRPQLKSFIAWNARRAMEIFHQGAQLPAFRWNRQDDYLRRLRTGPDAEPLRQFVRQAYGAAWARDVLGF